MVPTRPGSMRVGGESDWVQRKVKVFVLGSSAVVCDDDSAVSGAGVVREEGTGMRA